MKLAATLALSLVFSHLSVPKVLAQAIDYDSPEANQRDYLHSSRYVDTDNEIFRLTLDKIMAELRHLNPRRKTFSDDEISWAIMSYVRMKAVYATGDDRTGSQILETIYNVNSIDEQLDAGDCDELAFAAAGLNRLAGIPARLIGGGLRRMNKNTGHAWLQVYVNGEWINVELSRLSVKGWYRRNLQPGSSFLFRRDTEGTGYGVDPEGYIFRSIYSH